MIQRALSWERHSRPQRLSLRRPDRRPVPSPSGHEEDVALVQRACAGERSAVGQLSKRLQCVHRLVAIRATRVALPSPISLDDVVQDVLLEAWTSMDRYRGRSSLEGWLWGIVVHVMNAYRRRQVREQDRHALMVADWRAEDSQACVGGPDPAAVPPAVKNALLRLPEATRDVLMLRAMEGLGYEEIAQRQRISARAARGRYQRGMDAVRERVLGGAGGAPQTA